MFLTTVASVGKEELIPVEEYSKVMLFVVRFVLRSMKNNVAISTERRKWGGEDPFRK